MAWPSLSHVGWVVPGWLHPAEERALCLLKFQALDGFPYHPGSEESA